MPTAERRYGLRFRKLGFRELGFIGLIGFRELGFIGFRELGFRVWGIRMGFWAPLYLVV